MTLGVRARALTFERTSAVIWMVLLGHLENVGGSRRFFGQLDIVHLGRNTSPTVALPPITCTSSEGTS